jgi:hypothetical protein
MLEHTYISLREIEHVCKKLCKSMITCAHYITFVTGNIISFVAAGFADSSELLSCLWAQNCFNFIFLVGPAGKRGHGTIPVPDEGTA